MTNNYNSDPKNNDTINDNLLSKYMLHNMYFIENFQNYIISDTSVSVCVYLINNVRYINGQCNFCKIIDCKIGNGELRKNVKRKSV